MEAAAATRGNRQDGSAGRSFDCSFCKRGFSNAQALGGHMNLHRKEKGGAAAKLDPPPPLQPSSRSFPFRLSFHDVPAVAGHEPRPCASAACGGDLGAALTGDAGARREGEAEEGRRGMGSRGDAVDAEVDLELWLGRPERYLHHRSGQEREGTANHIAS